MKTKLFATLATLSTLHLLAGPVDGAAEHFTAHEWGTFTSVQGADGQLIQWNPLVTSKLPTFVYDRNKPGGDRPPISIDGKGSLLALQRMETPVIYFYSDQERTVDVTVRFPQGLITEWYPYAQGIGPSRAPAPKVVTQADKGTGDIIPKEQGGPGLMEPVQNVRESFIRWTGLQLFPAQAALKPNATLPREASGSHYYAARDTDADLVRVKAPSKGRATIEQEKFLFYRGLGSFGTPLQVMLNDGDRPEISLHNQGVDDLDHLFVLEVRGDRGAFKSLGHLTAGEDRTWAWRWTDDFQPLPELANHLGAAMRTALEKEGLYPREAAAMVQTWRDSWFEEQGLRVLYVLPRPWTDQVLPITISPQPREIVRVMVGRAELITPRTEWEVLQQIVQFGSNEGTAKQVAVGKFRTLGLGRFSEAAIRRVLGQTPSSQFSRSAWGLLMASQAEEAKRPGLARN